MWMVIIVLMTAWVLLALGVGVLLGRATRLRDRREAPRSSVVLPLLAKGPAAAVRSR